MCGTPMAFRNQITHVGYALFWAKPGKFLAQSWKATGLPHIKRQGRQNVFTDSALDAASATSVVAAAQSYWYFRQNIRATSLSKSIERRSAPRSCLRRN